MADFTDDEMTDLRTRILRDLYTPAVPADPGPAAPAVALSNYNRATKSNYSSDDVLNALKAAIENDREEELLLVYNQKYEERLGLGDDASTATTKATAARTEALYRWIRADVLESQLDDPGFQGSVADEKLRSTLANQMVSQMAADRLYGMSRAGGFGSARLRIK